MGLGVLEANCNPLKVPGTVLLFEEKSKDPKINRPDTLKKQNGIILHPQPSDDPNDPLVWKKWRRDLMFAIIAVHACVGGGQTPIVAAAFSIMAEEFDVSLAAMSRTTGFYMLSLAVGNLIASPTALVWGHRPVYLVGQIVFCLACVWCGASKSYGSFLAARVLEGLGVSPCECLPSSSISQVYFLHEVAFRLGVYSFLLLGGKNLVPLISACIIQGLSWNWVFYIVAIIVAVDFIATFFFVLETIWERKRQSAMSSRSNSRGPSRMPSMQDVELANIPRMNSLTVDETPRPPVSPTAIRFQEPDTGPLTPRRAVSDHLQVPNAAPPAIPKKTYREQLTVFPGRFARQSWWKLALRPMVIYSYPTILFSSLLYSFSVIWLIVQSELISEIFSADPYHFDPIQVGLLYIAPFVGGLISGLFGSKLCDLLVRYMTRLNKGVYEPEFRLVLVLPVTIFTAMGLIGFGWSSYNEDSYIVPAILFGFMGFGCTLGSTVAISYAVEAHRDLTNESLVSLNVCKNVLGFAFSNFTNTSVAEQGLKTSYIIWGSVELFICLFAIPLYCYGKRARHWVHNKKPIRILK